jgi:hypothetical protein
MRILTRSRQIRNALRTVKAQIPPKDWQRINSFVSRAWVDTAWQTLGLGGQISPVAAELRPLRNPEDWSVCGAQIRFILPLRRLYTNKATIGLVAHEFAHALRAAHIGKGWSNKMGGEWDAPGAADKYQSEERRADAIASTWGFRDQTEAMREERRSVLIPYISSHQDRILRQVAHRDRDRDKRDRDEYNSELKR